MRGVTASSTATAAAASEGRKASSWRAASTRESACCDSSTSCASSSLVSAAASASRALLFHKMANRTSALRGPIDSRGASCVSDCSSSADSRGGRSLGQPPERPSTMASASFASAATSRGTAPPPGRPAPCERDALPRSAPSRSVWRRAFRPPRPAAENRCRCGPRRRWPRRPASGHLRWPHRSAPRPQPWRLCLRAADRPTPTARPAAPAGRRRAAIRRRGWRRAIRSTAAAPAQRVAAHPGRGMPKRLEGRAWPRHSRRRAPPGPCSVHKA